jgi:DNA replication and repair protein RecF
MPLLAVQLENLRCLRNVDLRLDPKLTLITGANASGKTSLLEGVFFLGRGRSFRTRQLDRIIRGGSDALTVVGHLSSDHRPVVIGLRATRESIEARIGGQPVESLSALAAAFPVQVIDPNLHKLVEEGPAGRRRMMDWGVFHVEQSFSNDWQRYQRALRQRNAALRAGQPGAIVRAWDQELATSGTSISAARTKYIDTLAPVLQRIARSILGLDVAAALTRGWASELGLADALSRAWQRDTKFRTTTVGPHRADLSLRLDGVPAKDRASRGQQKLLAAALIIAQLELLKALQGRAGTLLLDDPAAELDSNKLAALMEQILLLEAQLIVTATAGSTPGLPSPGMRFHVEQGALSSML